MAFRVEKDSLGKLKVPANAYYGVQTQRAVENFAISGRTMPREFIHAMVLIKKAAAIVNADLGLLPKKISKAIVKACDEILGDAKWAKNQFPVDIYQTGSGTSSNMNVNEVIASRANEILGGKRGDKSPVHPNDHVNMGQSSNDVIPTATNMMVLRLTHKELYAAIAEIWTALEKKSRELWPVIKTGRTHLQDATPIRLGQEFQGYTWHMRQAFERMPMVWHELKYIALGGTAVGTGINTHPEFADRACKLLSKWIGTEVLRGSRNHFTAQSTLDHAVFAHNFLKTIAIDLAKIVTDIRWMGSGPRAGLGELKLPAVQPGSSIMPGKVNPVICESVMMVCQRVIGNDAAMTAAAMSANFELAMSMPLAAELLHESISLLAAACKTLAEKCIDGLQATDRGPEMVEKGLMLATALAPVIGYEKAAEIAKEADRTGRTIREVAKEKSGLSADALAKILDVSRMVENQQDAKS